MANLATLSIFFRAITGDYEKGVKRAQSYTEQLSGKIANKLVGAGAVVSTLNSAANALGDTLRGVADGSIAAGDATQHMIDQFANGIPIVGGLYNALGAVRDMALNKWEAANGYQGIAADGSILRGTQIDPEMNKPVIDMSEQIAEQERLNKLRDEAAPLLDKLKTNEQRYAEEVAKVVNYQRNGIITTAQMNAEIARLKDQYLLIKSPIADLTSALQQRREQLIMSANAIELQTLKERGASDSAMEWAKSVQHQITALEERNRIMEEGRAIHERNKTPLEQYMDAVSRLDEVLRNKGVSQEDYDRELKRLQDEYDGTLEKKSSLASTSGTAAVESRLGGVFSAGNVRDVQAEIRDNAKAQVEQQKTTNTKMDELITAVKSNTLTAAEF